LAQLQVVRHIDLLKGDPFCLQQSLC
jgi:hypothetical protein